jgi:hypothetical protein
LLVRDAGGGGDCISHKAEVGGEIDGLTLARCGMLCRQVRHAGRRRGGH